MATSISSSDPSSLQCEYDYDQMSSENTEISSEPNECVEPEASDVTPDGANANMSEEAGMCGGLLDGAASMLQSVMNPTFDWSEMTQNSVGADGAGGAPGADAAPGPQNGTEGAGGVETVGTAPASASDSRPLTPEEYQAAYQVFGDSLDYSQIRVQRGGIGCADGTSRAIGNTIYMDESEFVGDGTQLSESGKSTLIHELTHSRQYQHDGWSYAAGSLWAQGVAAATTGDRNNAYEWRPKAEAGVPYADWNPEMQAQAVQDYNDAKLREKSGHPLPSDARTIELVGPIVDRLKTETVSGAAPTTSGAGGASGGSGGHEGAPNF